jgi:hypothetical protein
MDLTEIGYSDFDWIQMAHVSVQKPAVVNVVLDTQFSKREGNFLNC